MRAAGRADPRSSLRHRHLAAIWAAASGSRSAGEPEYDDLERRLAAAPAIADPTITLEGDTNGAPHADPSAYAAKFTAKYEHRLIEGGVGHNLPQEAPRAFAQAVIDAGGF